MFQSFVNAPWQQVYDVLADGQPPMILRILALNTVFFILFIVRRMRGVRAMPANSAVMVQSTLIACNLLILFQEEVVQFLKYVI